MQHVSATLAVACRPVIGELMDPRPGRPVRAASTALRRLVDDAVGPGYDTPFLRLDLLLTGRESRCGCDACTARADRVLDEILASMPRA